MCQTYDTGWYDGLICKIKCIGVNVKLLKLIKNLLKKRLVLNGQTLSWKAVLAGVLQGSVLGPLFFLIYINGLSKNLSSNTKLFTNDTSIFFTLKSINLSTDQVNSDLEKN